MNRRLFGNVMKPAPGTLNGEGVGTGLADDDGEPPGELEGEALGELEPWLVEFDEPVASEGVADVMTIETRTSPAKIMQLMDSCVLLFIKN